MSVALIDGDILCYRCAFAAEKTKYIATTPDDTKMWGPFEAHKDMKGYLVGRLSDYHIWSRKEVEPEEHAVRAVNATLDSIIRKLDVDHYEIYLSGSKSFREGIAVTKRYKGNRDAQVRPVHYDAVREALLVRGGELCTDGLEADDLLGIRATSLGDQCVVVSIDKDLLQIPGQHYNWVDDKHIYVTPKAGVIALGCQVLSGDATDNVPGLPGVGEVKAQRALESSVDQRDLVARIREQYLRHAGGDEAAALTYLREQLGLVYILREKDFDSSNKWLDKYAT